MTLSCVSLSELYKSSVDSTGCTNLLPIIQEKLNLQWSIETLQKSCLGLGLDGRGCDTKLNILIGTADIMCSDWSMAVSNKEMKCLFVCFFFFIKRWIDKKPYF